MARSGVTLQDIATRTGVSKVTVSYVLNERETRVRISDATRRRVQEAACEMGYQPNAVARALTRRRSDTLTLVMQSPNVFSGGSGFTAEMMRGILDGANHCGYDLMLHTRELGSLEGEIRVLIDGRADGALLLRDHDDPLAAALHECGLPCVAVFSHPACPHVPSVDCDNVAGGRLATQHLLALGHCKIGFVGGTPASSAVAERRQGYEDALNEAGIAPRPELACAITHAHGDFAPLVRLMSAAGPDRPTALFVWSDDVAARALAVLHDALGLRAPGDVSVIGFDGAESVCGNCVPRLTSVAQPIHQIAHRAVETLARLIRGEEAAADFTHRFQFAPHLLAGATCSAPPLLFSLEGGKL